MTALTLIKFLLLYFMPLLLGGALIGVVFGGAGYFLSQLGLYETERQAKLVFWVFVSFGVFGGIAMAFQALFAFLKAPK